MNMCTDTKIKVTYSVTEYVYELTKPLDTI